MAGSISIIIVSYNTGPILNRCLDTVLVQENLHEVIIVNNGNPEDATQMLHQRAEQHAKVSVVEGQGNVGFATGCNLGVSKASGDYILILNPDCLLPRHALKEAVIVMEAHPEAWMAGCQLVNADGSAQGGSKRNLLTPMIAFSQAFRLHYLGKFPTVNLPEPEGETEPAFVPAISGAFMLIKRNKYDLVGGLDEGYFFHVEDLDLCRNIHQKDGKILYIPSIKAVHYRSSSKVSSFFIEKHKTAGFMHYFRKHYKPSSRWGLFELILLGIYARLVFRLPFLAVCRLLDWRHARSKMELQTRQLALLRHPVEHKENQDYIPFEPVMVAGSTGQVGLSIVRRLLAQNMETYGLYHQQVVDYQHPHLHWVQGDVASGFFRNIPDIKVKTLIHTPAIWHLAEHLDYFANLGIKRLICFSSTSIEGKATSENSYEKELVQKFIDAEESIKSQCNKLGIDCTIIRPTMIYGVGLDRNVSSIVKFIQQTGFFPIVKPGTGLRQPVHTDDLAKAVMAILTHPSTYGKTYNLSGGEEISYKDMVHRIFTVMGKKDRTVISPYLPYMLDIYSWVTGNKDTNGEVAKRMNYDLVFEHQEAANDFKYAPRNFLSGNKEDLGLAL